jgi:hypothetical protein
MPVSLGKKKMQMGKRRSSLWELNSRRCSNTSEKQFNHASESYSKILAELLS